MQFQNLTLKAHRGVVVGDQVWSETRVTGSGGGASLHGIGFGSSSVRSAVTNRRESWLRLDDGTEIAMNLNADAFKLRPGHELVVVLAGPVQGKFWPVAVKNTATGQEQRLQKLSGLKWGWMLLLIGAWPMNAICLLLWLGAGVGGAILPLAGNYLVWRYMALNKEFKGHVDVLMREAEARPSLLAEDAQAA